MGSEEGVGLEDFGTDAPLDGGFDFGFCARDDAGKGRLAEVYGMYGGGAYSFLNILEVV